MASGQLAAALYRTRARAQLLGERSVKGFDGGVDLGVSMGRGKEQRLVGGGRQVDALAEEPVEDPGEALAVRTIDVLQVSDGSVREEEADHGALPLDADGNAVAAGRFLD